MKKVLLILIAFAMLAIVACEVPENGAKLPAQKAVVMRGNDIIFETPCGVVEIINPLAEKNGGGTLQGAAVSTQPILTVMYANKKDEYTCWSYNQSLSYEQIIRNFSITDSLTYFVEGCEATVRTKCNY